MWVLGTELTRNSIPISTMLLLLCHGPWFLLLIIDIYKVSTVCLAFSCIVSRVSIRKEMTKFRPITKHIVL